MDRLGQMSVDEIWCVGDIVGYYAFPSECVGLIRSSKIKSVMGNHDLAVVDGKTDWFKENGGAGINFSRDSLNSQDIEFLKKLPYTIKFERDGISFYMTHGSPRDNLFEYVQPCFSDDQLKKMADKVDADIIVLAHTHVQMEADVGYQKFLNPGSVGQPRDGIKKSCFMVFDTKDQAVDWYRVNYDIDAAADAVKKNNLPYGLAERLYSGI